MTNPFDALNAALDKQRVPRNGRLVERVDCAGQNPSCPCQDGDTCHYAGRDPWPVIPELSPETK